MFQKAYEIASSFTYPIVVLYRSVAGDCYSSIGSCVIVNRDGWILTAHHIVRAIAELEQKSNRTANLIAQKEEIERDITIYGDAKTARINAIAVLPEDPIAFSVWVGLDHAVQVQQWASLEPVDLAVGKLIGFNPSSVKIYPKFRDPVVSSRCGTSLCKLGFPFHNIKPIWDGASNQFQFPSGALPMPRFPLEGMFTREIHVPLAPGIAPSLPLKLIETSTPGLRGQSGGPIFDKDGVVWAIQTMTANLELGFAPKARDAQAEHQFLNVGIGAHVEFIVALLSTVGVSYELSGEATREGVSERDERRKFGDVLRYARQWLTGRL